MYHKRRGSVLNEQDFLSFTQEKYVNLDIFGEEIKNGRALLISIEHIVSFCTQIQTISSYFLKTYIQH